MPWIDVCEAEDLEEESGRRFDHGGKTFAIFRNDRNEYYCTDGLCTHEEIHLADGLVMENTVECPKHCLSSTSRLARSRRLRRAKTCAPTL